MAELISKTPPAGILDRMRHDYRTIDTADAYREAVLNDLQDLLGTTRRWTDNELRETPEIAASVLNYGVPPITGRVVTVDSANLLAREIRATILRFDHRFDESLSVCAELSEGGQSAVLVPLRIAGTLRGLPDPVPFSRTIHANLDSGQLEFIARGRER